MILQNIIIINNVISEALRIVLKKYIFDKLDIYGLDYGIILRLNMSLDELNVHEKKLRFRPTAKVLFCSDSHIEDLKNEKSKMSSENSGRKCNNLFEIIFLMY